MKFKFNLGNVSFSNERNNWSEKRGDINHYHYEPAKNFEMKDMNLEVEFVVEELLQMVKSDEAIVGQLLSTVKELAPMLVQMKKERNEKEVADLKHKIYDLEAELEYKKVKIEHVEERANKLVKENNELKEKAKLNDRELY